MTLLLDGGADPNIVNNDGRTLLQAEKQVTLEIASLLIDRGADVNKPFPKDGLTPLVRATTYTVTGPLGLRVLKIRGIT